MKLCKDCKHCEPQPYHINEIRRFPFGKVVRVEINYEHAKCKSPEYIDPVTGNGGEFCSIVRKYYRACGKDGKLWEAK